MRLPWGFASLLTCVIFFALSLATTRAAVVTFGEPALDKWMYGNISGVYGGTRDTAPVFGYPNTPAEEDRLGQLLLGFNLRNRIPTGLAPSQYQVTRVTMSVYNTDNFTNTYDPTADSYRSHLTFGDSLFQSDTDAGRPVEVFGVGLRNGFTALSPTVGGALSGQYHENSPMGAANTPLHGRNAYPLGYGAGGSLLDV